MPSNPQSDIERREIEAAIISGWAVVDLDGTGHDEEGNLERSIDTVQALIRRREREARIEEIEDIDQSRDVEEYGDGYFWCKHCTMQLQNDDSECACNFLYDKRKRRLAQLKAEEQQ